MAYQDCIARIKDAAGVFSEDELADALDQLLQRRARLLADDPTMSPARAGAKAAEDLAEEEKFRAIVEKRARAKNVQAKLRRISAYAARPGKEDETLRAINVGSEKGFHGAGASVDAERVGIVKTLLGGLIHDLRKGDLLERMKGAGADMQRLIAREMARASGGDDAFTGGATGDRVAEAIGKTLAKYQELARTMTNAEGAWIRRTPGWIVRQSHDQLKIARAGYQAWRDAILPRLDPRTFDGALNAGEVEDFLKSTWQNLASGDHQKASGAVDSWLAAFKGPANRARKASAERVLHFKSASDWFDYHQQFGSGSLFDATLQGIEGAARNIALMRRWGTNPQAAFDADLDLLKSQAKRRDDLGLVDRLKSRKLQAEFDVITSASNVPSNLKAALWARNAQTVRNAIAITKLPMVLISSLGDVVAKAATLRHNGVGFLDAMGNGLDAVLQGRTTGEQREIADLIGVGFDGLLGHVFQRFSALDGTNGYMAKTLDTVFRLNLQHWWTDAQSTSFGLMLSRNLANRAGDGFDALPELLRINLNRYGIGADDWEKLRGLDLRQADGRRYFTPDAARQIEGPDGKRLETALATYFNDQTGEAMGFAGARQKALMTAWAGSAAAPGTALGEALRFIMQFKSYGISFAQRQIGREFQRTGRADWRGLSQLMVSTIGVGYLSMLAKDFLKGKNPRDPSDPKTWLAALQQGGGFGIYGDFLFSDVNRFGGGLLETAAGPAAGTVADGWRTVNSILRGEDASSSAVRYLGSNAPLVVNNLFYTKLAFDTLILANIQNWLNPGSVRRAQARLERQNNQTYWLPLDAAVRN